MSQVTEISLDDMGRILIPATVQSRLGLLPGMRLIVEESDKDGVRLRIQSEPPVLVDKAGVLEIKTPPFICDSQNFLKFNRSARLVIHRFFGIFYD